MIAALGPIAAAVAVVAIAWIGIRHLTARERHYSEDLKKGHRS